MWPFLFRGDGAAVDVDEVVASVLSRRQDTPGEQHGGDGARS